MLEWAFMVHGHIDIFLRIFSKWIIRHGYRTDTSNRIKSTLTRLKKNSILPQKYEIITTAFRLNLYKAEVNITGGNPTKLADEIPNKIYMRVSVL